MNPILANEHSIASQKDKLFLICMARSFRKNSIFKQLCAFRISRIKLIFLENGGRIGYIQTTVAGRDKKIPPFGSSLHNKAALKTSLKRK